MATGNWTEVTSAPLNSVVWHVEDGGWLSQKFMCISLVIGEYISLVLCVVIGLGGLDGLYAVDR